MKQFLLMSIAGLAITGIASANHLCGAPDAPAGPVNVAGLTLVCNGLTFSNFDVVPAAGNPHPEVDLVSANVVGGSVYLNFNPNISAPPSGSYQDLYLYYQVTGHINGVDLGVGGVGATIQESACSHAFNVNQGNTCASGLLGSMVAYSAPPGPSLASILFPAGSAQSPVYLFKDIGVTPGGSLTSFSQSFETAVPEPVSFLLMGSGLLGLGLLRRRNRKA